MTVSSSVRPLHLADLAEVRDHVAVREHHALGSPVVPPEYGSARSSGPAPSGRGGADSAASSSSKDASPTTRTSVAPA